MRFALFLLAVSFASCSSIPALPKNTPPTTAGYRKVLEDRLGAIWFRLMNARVQDVRPGTVKVTFEIPAAGGHPRNYQVISNTADALSEGIAREAVARLTAPPLPEAVLKEAKSKDVFTMEESFTADEDGEPTPAPKER